MKCHVSVLNVAHLLYTYCGFLWNTLCHSFNFETHRYKQCFCKQITCTVYIYHIFYHTMSLPFSSRLIVTCTESQESHCVAPTNILRNYWFVGHCAPVEVGSWYFVLLFTVAFLRPFRWYLPDFWTINRKSHASNEGLVNKNLPDHRCCCHVACPRNGGNENGDLGCPFLKWKQWDARGLCTRSIYEL